MGTDQLTCPICQADQPTGGDERPGDEFYCPCCGAPGVLAKGAGDQLEVEEDF